MNYISLDTSHVWNTQITVGYPHYLHNGTKLVKNDMAEVELQLACIAHRLYKILTLDGWSLLDTIAALKVQ